jgi:hypothetical protein
VSDWIPCGADFIEADVVRWKEPVWKPKGRRNSRSQKIGERQVTAQVLKVTPDGWVQLLVKRCVTTNAPTWLKTIPPLKQGGEVRRQRKTIGRGAPERLRWSDEGARASVTSRFLNADMKK